MSKHCKVDYPDFILTISISLLHGGCHSCGAGICLF